MSDIDFEDACSEPGNGTDSTPTTHGDLPDDHQRKGPSTAYNPPTSDVVGQELDQSGKLEPADEQVVVEPISFTDLPEEAKAVPPTGKPKSSTKRQGEFFVADRRILQHLIDQAPHQTSLAAFLAVAACTDSTNTKSRAGVNAVCNYLGLGRRAAMSALDGLVQIGALERLEVTEVRDPTQSRFRIKSIVEIRGINGVESQEDPDAAVFLPNALVRPERGRSAIARVLSSGPAGGVASLIALYIEQDFDSFSGLRPTVLHSSVGVAAREMHGRSVIQRLEKPAALKGYLPQTSHLGGSFRDLKTNPMILEYLHSEAIVQWVVWMGQGSNLTEFSGHPLVAFGPDGVNFSGVESYVGLAYHLLAQLIVGEGQDLHDISQLKASFVEAALLRYVASSFGGELKPIATCKLSLMPNSVRALAWSHRIRRQCRQLIEEIVLRIERDFPSSAPLAHDILQVFGKTG